MAREEFKRGAVDMFFVQLVAALPHSVYSPEPVDDSDSIELPFNAAEPVAAL